MSSPTPPVVVAIADKQPSALRFAISEARAFGAPLRVVYAYGVPARASQFNPVPDRIVRELRAVGEAVLDAAKLLVDEVDPKLSVEFVLSSHIPLDALSLEAASARVMVLGSDDVPWYDRLLRTKIAGYLARYALCPVIVVPELEFPVDPGGEVVLTLDGDTAATGPVRLAFEEANARDCVLHVLHCTPPGTLGVDVEAARANVAEVVAGWCETYPDVAVLEADAIGDTAETIARATRNAELVVVGRPHDHVISFPLSQPVAIEVLRKAKCPVAVVPATY
ncbi:nucleotide-binding universal stress UspA family protein [Aeromicrobium panaciterrae]|uniref:Nucleotide-binding universal stress UspA family protein n=1 Tax=Aeromicrobium panaciterrae TaxID=363861 RepID=A0ABU1UJ72_9ACTN|nr:universal stress protein [Aeromicrobium panaciterrae]MDR7085208.1 nucleotide-binding universal stress UspA family protein [Aeromicrobium panaciterrae]